MTNNTTNKIALRLKIVAAVMAATCILSATAAVTTSAATTAMSTIPVAEITETEFHEIELLKSKGTQSYTFSAYGGTSYGYDWDYYIDNTNVDVKCKYDFGTGKYSFIVIGKSAGTVNAKLKYKTSDTKWETYSVTLKVDSNGNVTKIS